MDTAASPELYSAERRILSEEAEAVRAVESVLAESLINGTDSIRWYGMPEEDGTRVGLVHNGQYEVGRVMISEETTSGIRLGSKEAFAKESSARISSHTAVAFAGRAVALGSIQWRVSSSHAKTPDANTPFGMAVVRNEEQNRSAILAGRLIEVPEGYRPVDPNAVLCYSPGEWRAFIAGVRNSEFDVPGGAPVSEQSVERSEIVQQEDIWADDGQLRFGALRYNVDTDSLWYEHNTPLIERWAGRAAVNLTETYDSVARASFEAQSTRAD